MNLPFDEIWKNEIFAYLDSPSLGIARLVCKKWAKIISPIYCSLHKLLVSSAEGGHEDLCHLTKKWGATDFDSMLKGAAFGGHEDLCRLAKEWGHPTLMGCLKGLLMEDTRNCVI